MTLSTNNTAEFAIRPMTAQDLPRLNEWLQDSRVKAWFDEPDMLGGLASYIDDPRVRPWIVERKDLPIAYLQDYEIHAWPQHYLGFLPKGARGLDTFVGQTRDMGQGLASRYLAQHCRTLKAENVPTVGIDPHPENHPAIRCYEKVGFRRHGVQDTEWGPVLTMSLPLNSSDA